VIEEAFEAGSVKDRLIFVSPAVAARFVTCPGAPTAAIAGVADGLGSEAWPSTFVAVSV